MQQPLALLREQARVFFTLLGCEQGAVLLRVFLQQAGVAVHHGQRRFQLVGDAGDEIFAQQLVAAQLPRHAVEVHGQLVHLVLAVGGVHLHVEIPAGDGAGRIA